ncbi:ribonuclease HII [Clostridium sp.]|uniref:ribonuclease HII n=1 Tax=Clostridium sp. TaxID=1506 RepID=UPI003F2FDB5D
MSILDIDLKTLSYKDIKEKVDKIIVKDYFKSNELPQVIEKLNSDSRKNVSSLGSKLFKEKEKLEKEILRVRAMYTFDESFGDYKYVAGVDEVGRGPLAGPIVACAVILDRDVLDDDLILGLNDSKKISEKKREELAEIIKRKAIAYHIAECSSEEIDSKGIAFCNNEIFIKSCTSLGITPDLILSDGYLVKNIRIENKSVIKGDTKSAAIAAASIVAKVYRDKLMKEYAKKYPDYAFEENAGYGTNKHIEGLKTVGPCDIHRLSFLRNIL